MQKQTEFAGTKSIACDLFDNSQNSQFNNPNISFDFISGDYSKTPNLTQWEIFIIVSGEVTHEINGQAFSLKKGDAALIRPKDTHRLYNSSVSSTGSYQHINFVLSAKYMRKSSNMISSDLYSRLLQNDEMLSFTASDELISSVLKKASAIQARTMSVGDNSIHFNIMFQEIFSHFLNQFMPSPVKYPIWLSKLLAYLQTPESFALSTVELAQKTPYSYSRLSRLFKQYMSMSLVDYITDIKISHAKALLENTNETVLSIAAELDFTLSYFTRLFKQKTGFTPGEYRVESQH